MSTVDRWLRAAGLLAVGATLAGSALAGPPAGDDFKRVKDLTRSADFVFLGTVEQTGAANLSIVEPDVRTAIVRVDRVLEAGGTLDDFTGQAVTVFSSQALGVGDRLVFFTQVRLLGESLGVAEVGRPAGKPADVEREVGLARSEIVRDGVSARLAAAELVVSGRVVGTRPVYPPAEGLVSEHDPLWWEAQLEVRSLIKGKAPEKTVAFWFPSSLDVQWVRAPKPGVGHEGTWALRRLPLDDGAEVLAAADPQDLLSPEEAEIAEGMVNP